METEIQGQRKEVRVRTETEGGQQPLAAKRGAQNGFSLRCSRRNQLRQYLISDFWSPEIYENTFLLLKPLARGTLLHQPKERNKSSTGWGS